MSRDSKVYLQDILEAIRRIEVYTQALSFEQFQADEMRIDAVLRNVQVIGEAARQVSETIRTQYSAVNWPKIVGLRNVVVHEYFRVNLDMLWSIVQNNIPLLRTQITTILQQEQ